MLSLFVIIFAVLLGADVMFKQRVEEDMEPGDIKELFGGKVVLRKVYNRGFLLNTLDDRPGLVKRATVITSIGILMWDAAVFLRKGHFVKKLGMALLSAGAASNAFDRLARGKVIDYIAVRSKKKFLAGITVNLGDICIACGGVLVMLQELVEGFIMKGGRTP